MRLAGVVILGRRVRMIVSRRCRVMVVSEHRVAVLIVMVAHRAAEPGRDRGQPLNGDRERQ